MFTIDELLSKKNQRAAKEHLVSKHDSCGADGIHLSEFPEYWEQNNERILKELREGSYVSGVIKTTEIINGSGKRRIISTMNTQDRFICRLLAQKLKRYLEPSFLENSQAYQENKGVLSATEKARTYIEEGNIIVVEIDIKDFFDTILLEKMLELLNSLFGDDKIISLFHTYLYCQLLIDDEIIKKEKGLVQGNPISPILSNLYLHSLDIHMDQMKYQWIRFSDNIYVYCKNREQAQNIFNHLSKYIPTAFELKINQKKSGIYDVFSRVILGYEFFKEKTGVGIRRHKYDVSETYHHWRMCKVQKVNKEYHIIENGILTKKDYALLFENEAGKYHIPVEVVDQLNFYSDVMISSNVLKALAQYNIKVSFFDKYGMMVGTYLPASFDKDAKIFLRQVEVYNDPQRRLALAKRMEIASIHNMRSNLRYYNKRETVNLTANIDFLSKCMKEINEGKSIDELLLIEARARGLYYQSFNEIICVKDFFFYKRTKKPPLDAINAMISFGNTLLYNEFLRIIQMTALSPKVGVVHATNRRSYSLNLDFADIFKPIIVDRVIFSLINCHQLKCAEHFEQAENGAILLNKAGKHIFLEEFQTKMNTHFSLKGKAYTYQSCIAEEVRSYMKALMGDKDYHPYKYY